MCTFDSIFVCNSGCLGTAAVGLTWHDATRAERNLLRLVVEVADRRVKHHASYWLPRELVLWPVLRNKSEVKAQHRFQTDQHAISVMTATGRSL